MKLDSIAVAHFHVSASPGVTREEVRFLVRNDQHPGEWMFHCHILDHEDHGMMGVLEVR